MKRSLALVLALAACTRTAPNRSLTASGTVESTEARLGFQSGGRIAAVEVREGDRVQRGRILATLDAAELDARREQAVARIAAANALLRELQTGSRVEEISQASAMAGASEERVADARRDLERSRTLYEGGAISLELLQKAQVAAALAQKQLEQTRQQLQLIRSGPRAERIDAQRAQVREAEAALASVDALLANMRIASPIDGIVTQRHREPNETVAPGQPVVTLMNPNDRWVRVYVPEPRLGALRLGAPATIRSDTYAGKTYRGRIIWIAEQAEFTPKNVQTTEERVKLVYAVKVAIDGDAAMELKPGMPVDVVIE